MSVLTAIPVFKTLRYSCRLPSDVITSRLATTHNRTPCADRVPYCFGVGEFVIRKYCHDDNVGFDEVLVPTTPFKCARSVLVTPDSSANQNGVFARLAEVV